MAETSKFSKKYKILLSIFLFSLITIIVSLSYYDYIKTKKEAFELNTYKINILAMKRSLVSMIEQKKSATVALGLSISTHNDTASMIKSRDFSNAGYDELLYKLRMNTFYKNVWIQIISEEGISLYRSWTENKGDNLLDFRDDIATFFTSKKLSSSISVGKYNLSLKVQVPIFDNSKFIGVVEIISHFNSISKELSKNDVDSVVIVNKKNTQKIKYPFTNIYIDDYYIANFDAKAKLKKYIQTKGVDKFLKEGYRIIDGYLIVSYVLKDNKKRAIGTYVMFKNISKVSRTSLDFFVFKLMSIFVFILMLIVLFIIVWLYSSSKKQKEYYKKIINSSRNIIIINNGEAILSVNKVFFNYFYGYTTLQAFRNNHQCICEFFEKGDEYLQKMVDGESWVKYLIRNRGKNFKIKILFLEKTYYFSITASLISQEKEHYAFTLSDITEEELSKQKLEKLTITDSLTQIGNRRYFQNRIDEEMAKAHRYKHELSLIIFDIDNFKNVNDVYGHSVGDEVLIEYSKLVGSKLRNGDELCRIGGEEFIIIVPHTDINNAFKLAEKLRKDIEMHKKILPITVSFGVTKYIYGESAEDIFKRVDKALYKAKNSGRNKVVLS